MRGASGEVENGRGARGGADADGKRRTSSARASEATASAAACASPATPSRRPSGTVVGGSGSHTPMRPDFSSFPTPKTPRTPKSLPRRSPASPSPPQPQMAVHNVAAVPQPSPAADRRTPSRETPSRRRTQHIPVLSGSAPPRTASVVSPTAAARVASPSQPSRYDGARDARAVQRSAVAGTVPVRATTSKSALQPPTTSSVSVHSVKVGSKAAVVDGCGASSPPTLIPATVVPPRPLSLHAMAAAAAMADKTSGVHTSSLSTSACSALPAAPPLPLSSSSSLCPVSETIPPPPTLSAVSRKSSVWSSEHANRSVVLGASGTTLAPSAGASRRQTWQDEVDEEEEEEEEEGDGSGAAGGEDVPGAAAASPLSLPASGAASALRSAVPMKTTPRSPRPPTVPATSSAAASSAKKKKAAESVAAADARAGRRTPPQRSTTPLRKGACDAPPPDTHAVPAPPTAASPPQTPHKTASVPAPVASPRTPKMSPSPRPTATRYAPPRAAAGANGGTDALRGGLALGGATAVSSVQPTAHNVTAPAPAPTTTAATTTANSTGGGGGGAHSQRTAAMLSQTLSAVRPMAPVVHVRIRPVLPSVGESRHHRHVYFLDHENVMVTRARPGVSGTHATVAALSSSLAEVAMARRGVAAGGYAGTGTGSRGGAAPAGGTAADGCVVDRPATTSSVSVAGAAGRRAVSPASLYGGDAGLLLSPVTADNISTSKVGGAVTTDAVTTTTATTSPATVHRGVDGGTFHVVSSNVSPVSDQLQPLSLLRPPSLAAPHHNRTVSWTSQGSEEHSPSSRLSGGSPAASVTHQQISFAALGGAGVSRAQGRAADASRTRPWLTTFPPVADDEAPSPCATPREAKAGGSSGGASALSTSTGNGGSGLRGGRGGAAASRRVTAQGVERRPRYGGATTLSMASFSVAHGTAGRGSVSTTPTARATIAAATTTTTAGVTPTHHTHGGAAGTAHRRASRSVLGASVSVSAMSMLTMLKAGGSAARGYDAEAEDALERQQRRPAQQGNTSAMQMPGTGGGAEQHYSFEFVHDEEATQADVFEESVLRFADEALLAQNVAIVCYGPTGSGKTYSMMGSQAQPHSGHGPAASAKAASDRGHRSSAAGSHSPPLPHSRGHTPHTRGGAGESRRRPVDGDGAQAGAEERDTHPADDDDEGDGTGWPKLGSSWQYGYTEHVAKGSRSNGGGASGGRPHPPSDGPRSGNGTAAGAAASAETAEPGAASAGMAEMGILPRLVHTLLERRGEAITIRRDPARDASSSSAAGVGRGAGSAQTTPRPTAAPQRGGSLSLTLRDLTFYGIELYMDELCDLLDPGKRPIQAVSDMGGLAAVCQRINEARDYRIGGSRGGASHGGVQPARTGGGMPITSLADLRRAYRLAHGNRVTARHAQNDTSSRSHAIFLLQLDFDLVESADGGGAAAATAPPPPEHVQRVHSYVAMVDLAGCERVKQTKVEGAALREAQYINKSLSALASVVLSLHRNSAHVPYRDSKLTRLLRPCLEGGRVLTLVHVAPCSSTETLNTLKFADQIRHTHIPTHALTATSLRHRELLDVFADLVDPMQGQWEAQVRQAQLQLQRLCADVRLSYFSRAVGAVPHRTASGASIASDAVSELSAMSEVDDAVSLSPADVGLEEGPPPLTDDATAAELRRFALHTVMHRLMGPVHAHQRTTMRDAVRAIRRRKEHSVHTHRQQLQQRIEETEAALQRLTAANVRLAKENSTPLPRDPHALELNRLMRVSTEELGECVKEQAALTTLSTALRQRLAAQDDLEAAVDEQLHNLRNRTAQAMRTLSAAVAAHPPGGPPVESAATPPKEPTLPTGSFSTTAVVAMDTSDDPELRDIAHQQLSLAKELAALRLETACFEIGTGLWEGLWARAMRKEIVAAMEVETFAMERILLDRRALAMMMMGGDTDGEDGDAGVGAVPTATATPARPSRSVERAPAVGVGHHPAAAALSLRSPADLSPSATPRSVLWARLGSYLHGEAEGGEESSGAATPQRGTTRGDAGPTAAAAAPLSPLLSQRSRRDRAVDLNAATASDRSGGSITEPSSAIVSSSEGLRLRAALASAVGAVPAPLSSRRALEEPLPNPLMIFTADEPPPPLPPPPHDAAVAPTSLVVPRRGSTAAAVAAALTPLSLAGCYDDEPAMQEACLQLLVREGIPCEVCCLGESAAHTLQHFILPSSADAPMAEALEHEEPVTNSSAAPARYHVTAAAAAAAAAAAESGAGGKASEPGVGAHPSTRKSAGAASRGRSASTVAHERPGGANVAWCTTRQGRLRLVRMPRRPNWYVLEFVYTHQGLPLAPRLQAALAGKPEDVFTSVPGRTNLEQMVDALPSVHGPAGRSGGGGGGAGGGGGGGGGGSGGLVGSGGSTAARPSGPVREHRLFAIPLYEPTLRLHLHVLEEGIAHATTPVAATMDPSPDSVDGAAPAAGGIFERTSAAGGTAALSSAAAAANAPSLCIARRVEDGAQMVLEVRGVPQTASTRRHVVAADAKNRAPRKSAVQKAGSPHKAVVVRVDPSAGLSRYASALPHDLSRSPSRPSLASSMSLSQSPAPTGAGAAAWSDLVLAKRLGSGGELMLPSSCIMANTGCCSLVLRFPAPFSTSSASRVESVEAVVGALCGILRPAVAAQEVRASSSSSRLAHPRRRLSVSPRSTSAGGHERGVSGASGRRRSSVSRSPVMCAPPAPPELEVVNYAHVPCLMFTARAAASAAPRSSGRGVDRGGGGGGGGGASASARRQTPAAVSSGAAAAAAATALPPMARCDSLDGLGGGASGGVLGQTLQSSYSPAHGRYADTGAVHVPPPDASVVARSSRGNSPVPASTAVPVMEQQSGATLQVQFHWVPTPPLASQELGDRGAVRGADIRHTSSSGGGGGDGGEEADAVATMTGVVGKRRLPRPAPLTTATADADAGEGRSAGLVRQQMRAALSVLAQLSYVFADGRPVAGDVLDESSLGSTLTESSMVAEGRRPRAPERGGGGGRHRPRSRSEADAARFADAVAVASLMRQLDTHRQRIRRLFRQQLYDAEDVNGDDVAPPAPPSWLAGELGRGAYLRGVQSEVRRTVGLPPSTVFGGSAASPLMSPPNRHQREEDRGTRTALLELQGSDATPDTRVTVCDARQACATTVPWSVWQWAYRWSRLQQLLHGESDTCDGANTSGHVCVCPAEAAAAWLPSAVRSGADASPLVSTSPLLMSVPTPASPTGATASSGSEDEFVMGGDWLAEARLAARSKRVWLPHVLAATVPSYLENCAAAGV
ncbi:kinesin [Novymonas esmeraldas]|uniref:Kinesin n=1 Tax=Novymonas esmeraldas TaxID=1808958 RepID=A0AAW0EN34_9TRYP